MRSSLAEAGKIILSIIIAQSAGIMGSFFTAGAVSGWYTTLVRPELAPPNWVFAPVWTLLYTLMGIAAYLVWRAGSSRKVVRVALGIYGVQLALNALWSIIFFGLPGLSIAGVNNLGLAFAEIILLVLAIAATIVAFWRISRLASMLLAPYLLWVLFASYLNGAFWVLNS